MTFHSNGGGAGGGGGSLRGLRAGYSGDERESRSGGEERLDNDFNDKPVYLLEHLATFTVNKESGIVYPADGMRRLLQLEKTTGIWSQKMQLCLDCQWLLIMDYETGNIIERFPASLIQEPTAFTSTDAMELYNNILVFVVSGGSGSRSEMHIFQSQSVSAVHLVEDLKNLRNGKIVTQQREPIAQVSGSNGGGVSSSVITKSMITTSREQHHQHRGNVDQYGMREMGQIVGGASGAGNGETDSDIGGINDETSSTSSDKYERDVTVLNHCFDDIEKFIARLQHAAAASRELERRRRNRKTKKKDPGEGLLTLRTRPPHEKEFIDIFAKFKLSFNLLAKLKAHIHDPNAPELVHFLFTPLALIVEASSDTYYESQLPARVINPLLTREAINLLINCVTSKETELWRSLGDAWIVPRDQWKEDVGSYHPVFLDGWSPDYLVIDELETNTPSTPTNISKRRLEMHHIGGLNGRGLGHIAMTGGGIHGAGSGMGSAVGNYDEYDGSAIALSEKYTMHSQQVPVERGGVSTLTGGSAGEGGGGGEFGTRSEISIDSIERSGANVTTSTTNTGGQDEALLQSITAGLHNLNTRKGGGGFTNESGGGVSEGRNGSNSAGGATNNDNENRILENWLDNLQATGAKIVLVTYPRTANNDKELSVVRGEYLEILDDTRKWWKARNRRGHVAHVPHTIVTPYNYGDSEANNHFYGKQPQQTNNNYKETVEQRSTDSTDWIRNKHLAGYATSKQTSTVYAVPSGVYRQQQQPKENKLINPAGIPMTRSSKTYLQYSKSPPVPPPLPQQRSNDDVYKAIAKVIKTKTDSVSTEDSTIRSYNERLTSSVLSGGSTNSDNGAMIHEELKQVFRMRGRRSDLEFLKTPQIYIKQNSNPTEIAAWLIAKEFSPNILKRLQDIGGDELFALSTEQLEELFGIKEGRRLASQLMLQKSVSGYQTARSSELQAALARTRSTSDV